MSFRYPLLLAVALVVTAAAVSAYLLLQRRRTAALSAAGLARAATRGPLRRHLPYALFLAALPLLLVALARPQATLEVPRAAGTVMLVIDVSNSMAADDLEPTRLAAAQQAAKGFVEAQPDSVDIGLVVFGPQALTTQLPTENHADAIAAIDRLKTGGGTSLGQGILASLTAIVGRPVSLPEEGAAPPDLGYWPSATIVMFSDGEDTGGPDAEFAAELAAGAGVRIETVGIGTAGGATIEVDGFQVATTLHEDLLTAIAASTGGSYHQARDADSLNDVTGSIDLRVTAQDEEVELTAVLAGAALLILMIGALLMLRWSGRIL